MLLSRPVTVHLYLPAGGVKNIASARFVPARNEEGKPELMQLTIQQVVMKVDSLTKGGCLYAVDKRRLKTFLGE